MIRSTRALLLRHAAAVVTLAFVANAAGAEVVECKAKDTLTAVEMEPGDQVRFQLRDGRPVTLLLEDTDAAIVEKVVPGGIVYRFSASVRIDGQPMTLERFACSQECFYEPYVVNGLRIWPDIVKDVFDLIPVRYPREGNLRCRPRTTARLALQDASLRICPEEVNLWIEHEPSTLDVGQCYNGDDCYLGPYLGEACHVGMDINQPKGSVLFTPIALDTQAYFNSLAMGHNNNRWRGVRRWENGDVWALQSHHLIKLLIDEKTPLASGTKYATTAGVFVGSHEHTHFEFKTGRPRAASTGDPASIATPIDFDDDSALAQEQPEVLHLDPWIVFWQAFEDRKARRGELRAAIKPFGPARAGQPAAFSAEGSRPGPDTKRLQHFWTFGDGGTALGPSVAHVFSRPGVYSVWLTVDDAAGLDSARGWITVGGDPVSGAALRLAAADEPSFRPWPVHAAAVYGQPVTTIPRTLRFLARPSRPTPRGKIVHLEGLGDGPGGQLRVEIGEEAASWLRVQRKGEDRRQWLDVRVDAGKLASGAYQALVRVSNGTKAASPDWFRVELVVTGDQPAESVTVDDRDAGFYATPCFWVGHRFCRCPEKKRGYGGFYLTNGGRAVAGEFARFTPDLRAGAYEVALSDQTPFSSGAEFDVRVRHAEGEKVVRIRPAESRSIGVFTFEEGTDGFVEILAEGSKGLVIADAVTFRPSR